MTSRTISRAAARLFMVRRHFLAPPRSLPVGPQGVMEVFDRLGSIQFDPLDMAGRNHDLVLLSRVAGYRREWTDALLYQERRLFEAHNKGFSLLPTAELPWYRLTWARNREAHERDTFPEHQALVDELLARIRVDGALSSLDFEARTPIMWSWGRPVNPVRAMLEALAESGRLGLARRQGNRRYYDLIEDLFPRELLAHVVDPYEQRRHRLLSRFRAHGLLGRTGSAELWLGAAPASRTASYDGPTRGELLEDLLGTGELEPVSIEDVKGERYVVASEVGWLDEAEADAAEARGPAGVTFLAPLDPFMWDRDFVRNVFHFEYLWEVYVPEAKRRWGYYVLPILWGDRLVGRIEPRLDRKNSTLRFVTVEWESGFSPRAHPEFVAGLAKAIDAQRSFCDARFIDVPEGRQFDVVRAAARLLPAGRRRGTIRGHSSPNL